MHSPKFSILFFVGLCLIFIVSCKQGDKKLDIVLEQAGTNKKELLKVIDHYKKNPGDSLRLKAAYFLIKNMPYHSWKTESGLKKIDIVFDSIAKLPVDDIEKRKLTFELLLDSVAENYTNYNFEVISDIETLQSDYLIENIDLAFDAWYRWPIEKRCDFETFCEFILPYRTDNEPLESGTRRRLMKTYSWVFDSLETSMNLKQVADKIITEFKFRVIDLNVRSVYPVSYSISQFEKCRLGRCNDEIIYFVNLFRAIGIVSSEEIIAIHGNGYSSGHSFLRLKYGDEVWNWEGLRTTYAKESIPKIFRRTYSLNNTVHGNFCLYTDITQEYKETIDIAVDVVFNNPTDHINPVLCVFWQEKQWLKIVEGKQQSNKFLFEDIGTNVLYLPAYYYLGQLNAINYPFYVSPDSTVHYWKPQDELLDSIVLLRKTCLKEYRYDARNHWLDSLNNGFFQGANNPFFENAQVLAEINNLSSTHIRQLPVKNNQPFKYVRFCANKRTSFLALLEFLDPQEKNLNGNILKSNNMEFKWENGAFDNDPLTYSGGEDFTLGLMLDKPQPVGFVRFQSRNDDNHIRIGDAYELFFWDKYWKSLGTQTATDTLLIYHSIPKNSILWLRNHTRGREESAFVIDKYGKQNFLGSEY